MSVISVIGKRILMKPMIGGGKQRGDDSVDREKIFQFLEAFRSSMIRIGIVVFVFSLAGYQFSEALLKYLKTQTGVTLASFGLPESFFSMLTIGLALGAGAGVPYILFNLLTALEKVYPAFTRKMRYGFWFGSILFFYAGVAFCLFVTLPYGVKFLLAFEAPRIQAVISVKKFVSFCLFFLAGFGMIFELPLAMILFSRLGVVSVDMFSRYRRYAFLLIVIVAAVLTPTPDVINLSLMAAPLYLLYEIGIIGMRIWGKKPADGS